MHFRTLAAGAGGPWPGPFGGWARCRHGGPGARTISTSSSSASSASAGRGSYFDRVKGLQGPLKAALTSGSLSATGDVLAQLGQRELDRRQGKRASAAYDPLRTLRMFGFGYFFYGPYQFYWYNLLDWLMPVKTTATFLAKVAANQLLLAPVTLTAVFSWNLGLTGQADKLGAKMRDDLLPTMRNGWKFWIPAASLNFYAVPLQYQVLYMSACGVLWTAYLSYASINHIKDAGAAVGSA